MKKPLIYLITDGSLNADNYSSESSQLFDLIKVAVSLNISMIQIREKTLTTKLLFQLTQEIVKIRQNTATKILVNDRPDVAISAKADGVHLTANSIPTKIIRQNFPPKFLIGVSTHSLEKAVQARNNGADFAVFSPIFYTPDKDEPQGIEGLKEVIEANKNFPIIALGGINEDNFSETLKVGASGIAAIRMFNDIKKLPIIINKIRGGINE